MLNDFIGINNNELAIIARDHHENVHGTGYPRGSKTISLNTEIVIACDIYDARLPPRVYRKEPYNNRTALEELTKIAFDGRMSNDIVKFLFQAIEQKNHYGVLVKFLQNIAEFLRKIIIMEN